MKFDVSKHNLPHITYATVFYLGVLIGEFCNTLQTINNSMYDKRVGNLCSIYNLRGLQPNLTLFSIEI